MKHTLRQPSRSSEAGGALAIALLAVTAVTVLSMGFIQVSSSIAHRQAAAVENKRAFYLAEAGLAESFMALKAGKSGQIGFDEWPAAAGSGAFWVDVQGLAENRLRLDSHGLSGSGRATLSLVVEAQMAVGSAEKGVFTNHNLVVPKKALIDSFDSSVGTYEEHVEQDLPRYGARVGSNASIVVGAKGKKNGAQILGDAIPGKGASVVVQGESVVTGSVTPRLEDEEFSMIEVPAVALQPKLTHSSNVPFVIPPGEVGYKEIEIKGKGVLTITGPATVVAGVFKARDDGEIVFDTTNGAVDLYVTGNLELSQKAELTTTSARPADVRILYSGKNEVILESESHLLATVYAPSALVTIAKEFQIFGALTAKGVGLADEAQVHVDRSLLGDGAAEGEDAAIETVSWRVVEVPAPAMRVDPFRMLGVSRDQLPQPADAHDLSLVLLSVTYLKKSGKVMTYDGPEEDFKWKEVAQVVSCRRSLSSQHWEHDCSQHTSPRLYQNGYNGDTKSLIERLGDLLNGTGNSNSGSGSTKSGSGSTKSGSGSTNSGSGSTNSGSGSTNSGSGSTGSGSGSTN